ncbi:MAG: conjugal transfer protein TraG N-terminal domain-containing protein, partial [Oligoflexales bacterium]|nr:conjugal transfer protein TraG N-terminal domain-containing protein [Oligoflexales bacterium]
VRNAIKDSVIKNAEIVGASAAAQGFAVARAQEQQRNTFQILGDLSGKALASMTIVFQAILYASFMLIVLVVVQPNGFQFLKKYLGLVLWVQSWPPLFAIINYIQTEELRSASIAAATYMDGSGTIGVGWNLLTSPAIIQANLDIAALAGFYSISVPLIAISLVQGVQSFLSLASHLGAVTQGSAGHAGEEMTTGNYSYGNLNLDNYSANNTNANHWNTATTFSAGRSDWELSSGSTLSQMGDQSVALNQMSGSSQLMTALRLSDMYSTSLQQQSQKAESAMYNESMAYASGLADTATKALQLAKSAGSTTSEGKHYQHGENASVADAINKQKIVSNKLMEEYGVTEDQAVQLIGSVSLDVSGEIGTGKDKLPISVPGAVSSVLDAVSAKVAASLGIKGTASSAASVRDVVNRTKDLMVSEGATQSIDTIIRAAEEGHFNTGTDKQARLTEDFRSSLDETKRHERNYQASMQKMQSLQESASFLQSSSGNIEQNLQQFTLEKIANLQDAQDNRLGEAKADQILKDPIQAKLYIDAIARDSFMELKNNYQQNTITKEDLKNTYQDYSKPLLDDMKTIELHNTKHQEKILEQTQKLGINTFDETNISNTVQQQAGELLDGNKEKLGKRNKALNLEADTLKEKMAPKLNVNERGLTRRAISNAIDRTLNQDDKK